MDDQREAAPTGAGTSKSVANPSRRRLVRAGLGAAPIVLTVASRPVTAATCVQASAFASVSLGTSQGPETFSTCAGHTPDWWASDTNENLWPANVIRGSTKFADVFGSPVDSTNVTLLNVLKNCVNTGTPGVARYLVASYLNLHANLIPLSILDEPRMKNIWADIQAQGFYYPTAGIKWYAEYSDPTAVGGGVIPWLSSLMA